MAEGLGFKKSEEVKKNSKLSVQERLMRLYNEEKFFKERTQKAKFDSLPEVSLNREILEKKGERESVVEKKKMIDELKGAYDGWANQ